MVWICVVAARVNYKTLIIICTLFTLVTVLLWNKCSSDKAIQVPRHLSSGFRADALEKSGSVRAATMWTTWPSSLRRPSLRNSRNAPCCWGASITMGEASVRVNMKASCLINDEHTIKREAGGNGSLSSIHLLKIFWRLRKGGSVWWLWSVWITLIAIPKSMRRKAPYHPDGVFMSFQSYNVEVRDRVKCISGVEGWYPSTPLRFSIQIVLRK